MKKTRLLLADDDGVVLSTFSKGLRDVGYTVFEADTGETALRLAQQESLDLAILDVRMPGLSGIDTAKKMREFNLPVIFLSAYNEKETVESALEQGALGYLVKPIDVPRAIPTIEAALRRVKEITALLAAEDQLSKALDTGNVVNVVVGLIMERHHTGREQAFEILRKRARSERRKVKDVAQEVLDCWEFIQERIGVGSEAIPRRPEK